MTPSTIGVAAFTSWTADDGALRADLIPVRQRRRTSLVTRMAAHVLGEMLERTGVAPSSLATVYATAQGEIGVTVELLSMMHEDDGALSPLRFSGSVYNAAAGQLSIATQNRTFSTTITAGPRTVAMGLLEAVAALGQVADRVALIVAEEAVPSALEPGLGYDGLAAALLLCCHETTAWVLDAPVLRSESPPSAGVPVSVAGNPCAPALALVSALRSGEKKRVVLESGDRPERRARWCVDVRRSPV